MSILIGCLLKNIFEYGTSVMLNANGHDKSIYLSRATFYSRQRSIILNTGWYSIFYSSFLTTEHHRISITNNDWYTARIPDVKKAKKSLPTYPNFFQPVTVNKVFFLLGLTVLGEVVKIEFCYRLMHIIMNNTQVFKIFKYLQY